MKGPHPDYSYSFTIPAHMLDQQPQVSEVTRQLIERDQKGRQKYGTTLDRSDLSHADWLQHMAEELLAAAGYALAAKREAGRMDQVVRDCEALSLHEVDEGGMAFVRIPMGEWRKLLAAVGDNVRDAPSGEDDVCQCGEPERGGHAVWCPKRAVPAASEVSSAEQVVKAMPVRYYPEACRFKTTQVQLEELVQAMRTELIWLHSEVWPLVQSLNEREVIKERFKRLPELIARKVQP